ncbi:unnamed protein product [Brassica rapa subsp. trilocularis]
MATRILIYKDSLERNNKIVKLLKAIRILLVRESTHHRKKK